MMGTEKTQAKETETILPYLEKDVEQLCSIWNEVIEKDDAFVFERPFGMAEFTEMLQSQSGVYCATEGDKVKGFYILHPNFPGRSGHIANASYAVAGECRGEGVGKRLALHSLEKAKETGFTGMQFNAVVAKNHAANRLWSSLGFQKIGEVPNAFRMRNGQMSALIIYYRAL
ncbi:GNAT family N-acetyltransferase [Ruminococcaceae bacterium OttesenSCG-928-I18]|nr:GNAT family N-acetyltransferase [Ruminococcaceae bacterium OttesenSCG-928-I18]